MPTRSRRTFVLAAAAQAIVVVLAALGVSGLAGCTTFVKGEPQGLMHRDPAPLADSDWPARKTDRLETLATQTPKQIYSLVSEGNRPIAAELPSHIRRMAEQPLANVAYTGVHGPGILRVFDYGADNGWRGLSGTMRYVSYTLRTDLPVDPRLTRYAERQINAWKRRLGNLDCGLRPADADVLRMLSEGTAIRLVEPTSKGPVRGTVVYMSGLGSVQYEQRVVDELSARGYWLVRVATPRVWWYESKPWYIGSREEVPNIAKQLAGVFDDMVAESAYAVQAALEYLAAHRPDVPQSPLAIVAFSAGSLGAPAVVARKPDRFDAAVLIGGGANLLEISQTSDLTDGGIRLAWPENQPRGQWRKELFSEYLASSKLDPYHTAKFLRGKPTLLVQANLDITVPADNGWLLWKQLGKPDRYMHLGEHRTLFFTLKSQATRIADWLDDALEHRALPNPVARGEAHDSSAPSESSAPGG